MTDYRDGKIHGWNGGSCPVHEKDVVTVWYDDGAKITVVHPEREIWEGSLVDLPPIVAFRVVQRYEEPKPLKYFYGVVSEDTVLQAFLTYDSAERMHNRLHIPTTIVEFVENRK